MKKRTQTPPKKKSRSSRVHFTIGMKAERDYFIENIGLLVSSGMSILLAIDAIDEEIHSRRLKRILADVRIAIEAGSPLWKVLAETGLFPEHSISLIRLGEASGNLIENLKIVAIQQEKDRIMRSKLRSAMLYPAFVLSLTVIVGISIAWFILPKLATVFLQLKIKLPLITTILIQIGTFLGKYGQYVIPALIVGILALGYFIFIFPKSRKAGQALLLKVPGVRRLIMEVEIARFGYLLGTLLEAGLPITQALDALAGATEFPQYRKLFNHMRTSVEDGNSLQKSFALYQHSRRLIPMPIQQLIAAGERSGTLAAGLLKISSTYDGKADMTAKNLTVILEPILLVIVWLGVVAVAIAVILPIYSLTGSLNAS
jgi:type IV pilus assembly protein PilC